MPARITINATGPTDPSGLSAAVDLAAAVAVVIADYISDNGGNDGLTRGRIVETCLTGINGDEVNQWAADGDIPLEVAAAYHQLLDAVLTDPAALDRAVFGAAVIEAGQPVQWRSTFTTPDSQRGTWYAGGVWHGVIRDPAPDHNGDVLVGWGGLIRLSRGRRHRHHTRMSPAQLLNPDQLPRY